MMLLFFGCLITNLCLKCSGSSQLCKAAPLVSENYDRQSPVDIDTSYLRDTELSALRFRNHWDNQLNLTMQQKFNAVMLQATDDIDLTVEGGPLIGVYRLDHVLIHWCTGSSNGSEHSINGVKYSQEVHFVYFDTVYGSIQNALSKPDGLAIIAIFMDSKVTNFNLIYDQFVAKLHLITRVDTTAKLSKNVLKAFRWSMESQEYYLYDGSMTTPPYHETVIWLVMKKPVKIHSSHLMPFRSIGSEVGRVLCNTRDVFPLNGRAIYSVRVCVCCSYEQLIHARCKPSTYV